MAMRLQSAPSIQPLNKDFLPTTRTTHEQNELLVKHIYALQRNIKTWNIHITYLYIAKYTARHQYECVQCSSFFHFIVLTNTCSLLLM